MDCHPDVAHQLDFDSILTILSQFCLTTEGRDFIAKRTFLSDEEKIKEELVLVQSARELLERIKPFSTENFPAVAANIDALVQPNAGLEPVQLYRLARYLSSVSLFCAQVLKHGADNALKNLFDEIPILDYLSEHILSVIDEDGELIIANIDILDTLQQQRMDAAREIEGELKRIYRRNTTYYQSSNPVIRSNRFCLALNADFLGKVPSVVIDQSTSESTLFIEPLNCVQMNNRWIRYSQRFEHECRVFLDKLIGKLKEAHGELQQIMSRFAFLDSVLARAHFSKQLDCCPATFTVENIVLHQARHPLLGTTAVPIDINPASGCHATVISGPNGGGKTVTLKTIGLMVLMHYFAMHLPAAEGSCIPYCDHLLLLIGDQQSILAKQSSFTAHMQQLCQMTAIMNGRSIVLLDELGGNTDPEEGVALARAILSHCLSREAHTFVTTHFVQLKEQAIQHEQMELISMEYDQKRNKPRFMIVNGLSEGSYALQVAEAAGLDSEIIKKARSLLEGDAISYKNLLAEVTRERQEQLHQRDELLQRETQLKNKEREIERRENYIRFKYITEIEKIISSSRSQLEQLIAQVREKNISLPTKKIHSELNATSSKLIAQAQQMREEIIIQNDEPQNSKFQIGDEVHIDSGMQTFVITRLINTHTAEVSNGQLRLQVSLSRLNAAEHVNQTANADTVTTTHIGAPSKPFSPILDIRGKYTDEIEPLILTQIDNALYHKQDGFAIIHGVGSGALRKEVVHILDQNKDKLSWQYASLNSGGHGKTVVTLKSKK